MDRLSSEARGLLAAGLVAAPVVLGMGYAALAALDVTGVGTTGVPGLRRLTRVLNEPVVWRATGWSLWVALASTALSTVIAMLLAILFRGGGARDGAARSLAVLPLPVPHVVAGVLGLLILGQSGLLARLGHSFGWVATPADAPAIVLDPLGVGLIIALVWKEVPFLALIGFSVLAGRGRVNEEAARSLGARPFDRVRLVTLPLLWRGMLPAVTAVFVFVFGTYEAMVLLAPSDPIPLSVLIAERFTDPALGRRPDAFVLSLIALAITVVAVAVHEAVRGSWREGSE